MYVIQKNPYKITLRETEGKMKWCAKFCLVCKLCQNVSNPLTHHLFIPGGFNSAFETECVLKPSRICLVISWKSLGRNIAWKLQHLQKKEKKRGEGRLAQMRGNTCWEKTSPPQKKIPDPGPSTRQAYGGDPAPGGPACKSSGSGRSSSVWTYTPGEDADIMAGLWRNGALGQGQRRNNWNG